MDVFFEVGALRFVAVGAIPFEPGVENAAGPSLVTVVAAEDGVPLSKRWLRDYLDRLDVCDVYQKQSFLAGLVVINVKAGQKIPSDCRDYLRDLGNRWVEVSADRSLAGSLDPGPYLYVESGLKPVCRLYDDKQRAFLTALKPKLGLSESTAYQQLKAGGTLYDCLSVAVPPRAPPVNISRSRPRLRVAIKDCYRLEGLKTSLCNSAYYEFSDPAPFTAEVVQRLVKDGAFILGLTKLSSMIAREEPMDAVDFHTSFNPRADGYQSPAGSSSGSAASVAAYDWVDCVLGTDTSGSGRRPAMANGVWQFRPSHELVSLSGMVTTYPPFDTPCIFARCLSILKRVVETWIPNSSSRPSTDRGYNVIYSLDYLPVANTAQMHLIDKFIDDMKAHLPATVIQFSLRDAWRQSHPSGTPDDVDEYLDDVVARTYYYSFYHSTDTFRKAYADGHDGRPPYVIPFVQHRWAKGAAVSEAEHIEATNRMRVYKTWLLDAMFAARGGGETLVILPIAEAAPHYRDEPAPSPGTQSALDELFLPPILGAPDIVVPIGEVPYRSKISGQIEFLPVMVDIVGAPKADLGLFRAVERIMALSGRPTTVATGPRMFPGAKA